MRELDIKLLWGRSGNRCAICKLELSPNGDKYTLGEMAHIIARSPDGPRGSESLPSSDRGNYSNLILLCPTHHSEIDKDPGTWPSNKLLGQKSDHERWVSSQLEQGHIAVLPVDNVAFLAEREVHWNQLSRDRVWAVAGITPLSISGDVIDPLSVCFREFYDHLCIPYFAGGDQPANRTLTRPSAYGIVNEDLRRLIDGNGHRIEVFRNGHCEYLVCIQASVDQITDGVTQGRTTSLEAEKVIRYTALADTIKNQLETMANLWHKCLPFKDMTITWMLQNTYSSIMYSCERDFIGPVLGFPVTAPHVLYREVVNVDECAAIIEQALKRVVNSFGLVLDELFDLGGTWQRPRRMT